MSRDRSDFSEVLASVLGSAINNDIDLTELDCGITDSSAVVISEGAAPRIGAVTVRIETGNGAGIYNLIVMKVEA